MVVCGVAQREAAQVELAERLQRIVQAGACGVGAGAAQRFNQYLGVGKAFQHGGREVDLGLTRQCGGLPHQRVGDGAL